VELAAELVIELIRELISKGFTSEKLANELITLLVKRGKGRPRKNPSIIIFLQNNENIT
jgi:hypothetical protein